MRVGYLQVLPLIMYLLFPPDTPLPEGMLQILGRYSPRVESCAGRGYFLDFTGEPAVEQVISGLGRDMGKLVPGKLCGGLYSTKLLSRIITEVGLQSAQSPIGELAGKLTLRSPTPRFQLWQLPHSQQAFFLQELPVSFLWPCPPKILTAIHRLGIGCQHLLQEKTQGLQLNLLSGILQHHQPAIYYFNSTNIT